jgi:LCP family protein required for cell wall assembly
VTRRPEQGGTKVPYDRELIRSGGVSPTRPPRRDSPTPRRLQGRMPRSAPRRRRSAWGAIGALFTVALLGIMVLAVVLGLRAAAFNASVSSAPFPSTSLLGALNGSERVNVLLVGYGGGEHGGAFLADSIQILSIDPTTDTTTTIPVPRDLWIEGVASYDRSAKVNQVFSTGNSAGGIDRAGSLLAEVLSEVTGLDIGHWLSIDFVGFSSMVDAVGGVTVDNPVAFAYTSTEAQHAAGDWNVGSFAAGEIHLDGEQALAYSRARYTSVFSESNDFARSVRQARILGALRQELGDGGITSIVPGLRLMDAMEGQVRTDLSAIDLALLSSHLSSDRRVELTEGSVLTATSNTNGAYILVPTGWSRPGDYGGLHAYLSNQLSTDAP